MGGRKCILSRMYLRNCIVQDVNTLQGYRAPMVALWLVGLASNNRLSPLCGFESHSDKAVRTCPYLTLAFDF